MNFVGELLDHIAEPEQVAIVDVTTRLTYGELQRRSNTIAWALRETGHRPGERIGLVIAPSAAFIEAYLGVIKAGLVAVPLPTRSSDSELGFFVTHADLRAMIIEPEFGGDHRRTLAVPVYPIDGTRSDVGPLRQSTGDARLAPPAVGAPEDDAAIFFTSGSSGNPKAVRLSHIAVLHSVAAMIDAYATTSSDVGLCHTPLSHVSLHFMPLPLLVAGGVIVFDRQFSPSRGWNLLAEHGVTQLMTVTATGLLIAKHADTLGETAVLPKLRKIFTGGAVVPPEFARLWHKFAPHATVVNSYGMTEMSSGVARSDADRMRVKESSVGLPYLGMQVQIGEDGADPGTVGEIWAKGPSRMSGYLNNPDATARTLVGDWLRTGDLGYLDEDGYLYVVGRKDSQIKRGGEIVRPDEIEALLSALDDVREAAVLGRADPILGERVVAIIAPQTEREISGADIIAQVAESLSDYKIPEYIAVLADGLPKTATGKIDRPGLSKLLSSDELPLDDVRHVRKRRPSTFSTDRRVTPEGEKHRR